MKKAISIIILLGLLLTGLAGCSTPVSQPVSSPGTTQENGEENTKGEIGVSLSADNAFNSDFLTEFKRLSEESGFHIVAKSAGGDHKQQTNDILALIEAEVKIMVIDPVNIDELDQAIGECDTAGIPVIDLMEPINEVTDMLISPDYIKMGAEAAKAAKALLTNGDKAEGHVLMLQGSLDSFLMQMLHDGFTAALPESETLTQDGQYCDFDETKAYNAVKEAVASGKAPSLIFAQSESMAKGAIKAIDEAKASVKIVSIGADEDIISAIQNKKISTAVYVSPKELAEKASLYVQKYLKDNNAAIPTYTGIEIGIAEEGNASSLIPSGSKYARLPNSEGNSDTQESEEPESTDTPENTDVPESSQTPQSSETPQSSTSPAAT